MNSTYKIIWSDEALRNLKNIIVYLENNWTRREINKFARLLDHQLTLIGKNPFMFPRSDKSKGLRKSLLSRQTTIYFKVSEFEIQIVTLFDNRQNPDKLNKKLGPSP